MGIHESTSVLDPNFKSHGLRSWPKLRQAIPEATKTTEVDGLIRQAELS
jgi:hypothetical protein